MATVHLALGSNLGDRRANLDAAVRRLRAEPGVIDQPGFEPRRGAREAPGRRDQEDGAGHHGQDQPDDAALKAFLTERLAGYKVPKIVLWVDAVQRSPAGKQDYRWAKEVAAHA